MTTIDEEPQERPPRYQACPFACIICTECITFLGSNATSLTKVLAYVRRHETRNHKGSNALDHDVAGVMIEQALKSLSMLACQHMALQKSGQIMDLWNIYRGYLREKKPAAFHCSVCNLVYQSAGSHYKTACFEQQRAAASMESLSRVEIYTCRLLAQKCGKGLPLPLIPSNCTFDPASTPFCPYYQNQLMGALAKNGSAPSLLSDPSSTTPTTEVGRVTATVSEDQPERAK